MTLSNDSQPSSMALYGPCVMRCQCGTVSVAMTLCDLDPLNDIGRKCHRATATVPCDDRPDPRGHRALLYGIGHRVMAAAAMALGHRAMTAAATALGHRGYGCCCHGIRA